MGIETMTKLMEELNYEFIKEKEPVFKLGDIGTKFYIILSGSVNILVPKKGLEKPLEERESMFLTDGQADSAMRRFDKSSVLIDQTKEKDQFLKASYPDLLPISILFAGSFFGEVALRQNIARTATVVAKENCHLATLSRDAFNQIISKYYDSILSSDLEFLKKIPFFSQYTYGSLEQILYQFKKLTFPLDYCIYKEGQKAETIYFVKEGSVEVSVDYDIYNKNPISKLKRTLSDWIVDSVKRNKMPSKRISVQFPLIKVGTYFSGNYFGHEEIIEETVRKSCARVVTSSCVLYGINRNMFFTMIQNKESLNIFYKLYERKKIELFKRVINRNKFADDLSKLSNQYSSSSKIIEYKGSLIEKIDDLNEKKGKPKFSRLNIGSNILNDQSEIWKSNQNLKSRRISYEYIFHENSKIEKIANAHENLLKRLDKSSEDLNMFDVLKKKKIFHKKTNSLENHRIDPSFKHLNQIKDYDPQKLKNEKLKEGILNLLHNIPKLKIKKQGYLSANIDHELKSSERSINKLGNLVLHGKSHFLKNKRCKSFDSLAFPNNYKLDCN